MLDANDMAARADVETGDTAFLGVDAVREALDRFIMALVDLGNGIAADRACEDDIERGGAIVVGLRLG
jgi:hypothetical protein